MKGKLTLITGVAAAALLAGCGSNAPRHVVAPPPKLPHALAAQLATLSDSVAQRLGAGDSCGALASAGELESRARAAVASGAVPQALRRPLTRATTTLALQIQCIPPPARPDHHEEHGKGKHKGHGGEGD